MKTLIFILSASILLSANVKGQFFENFDQNTTGLSSNCWNLVQINYSTTSSDVINGTGSAYTNPPTSTSGTRSIATPFLNMTSTSLTVSFKYKTSSKIAGNATRTIDIGISDRNGVFTSLQVITMDKNTPTTVLTHNNTYTIPAIGVYRLELRIGGATGDGNSRVIFDDLSVSASAYYGPTYHCNPAATAVDDTDSLNTISVASGSVLANDQFPGDNETYTPTLITPPTVGTLVFNSNGTYSYTPPAGYTGGTITFTYSVTDNGYAPATSNIATVTIKYASLMMLAINNNRPTYSRNTNTNNNNPESMEINIRQNPVSSTLQFAFTTLTKQQTLVSIYSMTGALVHQENKSSSKGKNMVNVNVQSLPKGMYVVMLSGWNVKEAAKFIKQ